MIDDSSHPWRDPDHLMAIGACALMWVLVAITSDADYPDRALLLAAFGALAVCIVLMTTRASAWWALGYVAVSGVVLRLQEPMVNASDSWRSIIEALATLAGGANPYTHLYTTTSPPGSPMPYLPGAFLYGAIENGWWNGLAQLDRPAGIGIVLAFAVLARIYGPSLAALAGSIYAISALMIWRSVDGSNDTAVALLTTIGVLSLVYARVAPQSKPRAVAGLYLVSAIFFGWAIGFKALAWPIYAFVARAVPAERRRVWILVSLGFFAALCAPFLLWNPRAFCHEIGLGFTLHTQAWGLSVWSALDHYELGATASLGVLPIVLAAVVVAAVAYLLWRRKPETIGQALAQGAALLAVILALPRWSTSAYYTYAFTIVALAVVTFPMPKRQG